MLYAVGAPNFAAVDAGIGRLTAPETPVMSSFERVAGVGVAIAAAAFWKAAVPAVAVVDEGWVGHEELEAAGNWLVVVAAAACHKGPEAVEIEHAVGVEADNAACMCSAGPTGPTMTCSEASAVARMTAAATVAIGQSVAAPVEMAPEAVEIETAAGDIAA